MHYQHGQIGSPTNPAQKYGNGSSGHEGFKGLDKTSPGLVKPYGEKYFADRGLKKRDEQNRMSDRSKQAQHKAPKRESDDQNKKKSVRKPKAQEERTIYWREAEFLEASRQDEGAQDNEEENKDGQVQDEGADTQ